MFGCKSSLVHAMLDMAKLWKHTSGRKLKSCTFHMLMLAHARAKLVLRILFGPIHCTRHAMVPGAFVVSAGLVMFGLLDKADTTSWSYFLIPASLATALMGLIGLLG